jgi:hypothetical protein
MKWKTTLSGTFPKCNRKIVGTEAKSNNEMFVMFLDPCIFHQQCSMTIEVEYKHRIKIKVQNQMLVYFRLITFWHDKIIVIMVCLPYITLLKKNTQGNIMGSEQVLNYFLTNKQWHLIMIVYIMKWKTTLSGTFPKCNRKIVGTEAKSCSDPIIFPWVFFFRRVM